MSLLTPAVLAYVGRETATVTEYIDPSRILAFAKAVCHPEPPDARWTARDAEAPFNFVACFVPYAGVEPEEVCPPLPPTANVVKAGGDFEVFRPVRPGDVLQIRHRLASLSERPTPNADRIFSVFETSGTDADGQPVFRIRTTMVRIYAREESGG